MTSRRGEIRLRGGAPQAAQTIRERQAEMTRQLARLIEPARTLAGTVQRNRHHDVGAIENLPAGIAHARREGTSKSLTPAVLERVHDRAQ